ncbi:MAG: hypothetical protein QXE83_00245, partial [Archaeoglobaceae archaeon]
KTLLFYTYFETIFMLYNFDSDIEREIEKIQKSSICDLNKELIFKFYNRNKPFSEWNEEGIIEILAFL